MCRKKIIHINRIRKGLSDILGGSIGICSDVDCSEAKENPW